MKNCEKYKTAEERAKALRVFCNSNKTCKRCTLHDAIDDVRVCAFHWLELEAKEEEKPLPCPFCGGECLTSNAVGGMWRVYCERGITCLYSSGTFVTKAEAIAAHNRVCRAVKAAKEGEVK